MPRLSLPLQTALREAVAARFGQPLRYPSHCDALEVELQKSATSGRRLSPSTLRRFFGLVAKEQDGGYHLHTLDTLARYAGHSDFAAFSKAASKLAPPKDPAAVPELLAMERLALPERLQLGYFLGRVTRPAMPTGDAAPLALQLASHPAGQEFFVESFVDMAYLNGAYGQILREYLQHKHTPEAQLFAHCTLFLGEFLAEDEPAWRRRLAQLLALPVPPETHAFPQGRRAYAEIVTAWYDAPDRTVPAPLLARLRQHAATVPPTMRPTEPLPEFYNPFPAGYHFFISEALFLTGQFTQLLDWLEFTHEEFPELATLEHNVYNELLRAFYAVARLRCGLAPNRSRSTHSLFNLETHTWLLDYFRVHMWLVDLHLTAGTAAPEVPWLHKQIQDFAALHRMPFFARVAGHISASQPPLD